MKEALTNVIAKINSLQMPEDCSFSDEMALSRIEAIREDLEKQLENLDSTLNLGQVFDRKRAISPDDEEVLTEFATHLCDLIQKIQSYGVLVSNFNCPIKRLREDIVEHFNDETRRAKLENALLPIEKIIEASEISFLRGLVSNDVPVVMTNPVKGDDKYNMNQNQALKLVPPSPSGRPPLPRMKNCHVQDRVLISENGIAGNKNTYSNAQLLGQPWSLRNTKKEFSFNASISELHQPISAIN